MLTIHAQFQQHQSPRQQQQPQLQVQQSQHLPQRRLRRQLLRNVASIGTATRSATKSTTLLSATTTRATAVTVTPPAGMISALLANVVSLDMSTTRVRRWEPLFPLQH